MINETDRIIAKKHALYLEAVRKLETHAPRWSVEGILEIITHKRTKNLQGKQVAVTRSKDELDFWIGNKPGTYRVRAVDMAKDAYGWARVHFVYPLADGNHTAIFLSTFICARTRTEPTGRMPPTFYISDDDHPVLDLYPNYIVRMFDSFSSLPYTPHVLSLNTDKQLLDATCLAD